MASITIIQNSPTEHAHVKWEGFDNTRDALVLLRIVENYMLHQLISSLTIPQPEEAPADLVVDQTELPLN